MIIEPSKAASSVKEYYFSKKLKEINEIRNSGIDIINLGIGSPDLPPPRVVIDTLKKFSSDNSNHSYQSYRGIYELREAFSYWYKKYFNVNINPENEVLPVMGSKIGVMYVSKAFLNVDDEVLIPNPSYPTYLSVTEIVGAKPILYDLKKENNFYPDFNELRKKDLSKVKIMWINYPNMPTGQKATKHFFEELISFGKENNILICNDNPYNFILNEDYLSILSIKGAFDTAIELNSLSKSHNMAGWRVGAVFGNKNYLKFIQKIQSNMISGMFLPIQQAAISALKIENSWYENLNFEYKKRQKIVWEILELLNCKFDKETGGMFVWAEIPNNFGSSYQFSDYLLKKYRIFISPGSIFGSQGRKYIRISLCSKREVFLEVLFNIKQK